MRKMLLSTVATLLLAPIGYAETPAQPNSLPALTQIGFMNNAFASDLYAQLGKHEGNLFFSPISIETALAMTSAGARGATATEMRSTLHLNAGDAVHENLGGFLAQLNADGKTGGYELAVANSLWGAKGYPFMPGYIALVKKDYAGELNQMDYVGNPEGSRKTINDWVSAQTHDRIKDLLPAGTIGPDTRLVLTNAIYFKGQWYLPFKKELTKDGPFTATGGKQVNAAFMHQQSHYRYAEDDTAQMLELPYGKNDLLMRVILPKKVDGLAAVEKRLGTEQLTALETNLRRSEVIVSLPKFKLESQFSLAQTLAAMGMKSAFDPALADFTGMSSTEKLVISAVIHKAFVNVDEEGTEAAAATGVTMRATAMRMEPARPVEFTANHPFVFEIVHRSSGAVLFMGRLATP